MAATPTTSLGAREGSLSPGAHQILPNGLPGPVMRGCGVGTEGTNKTVGKLRRPVALGRPEPP